MTRALTRTVTRTRSRAGFTLVEVMVALVVTGLVVLAGYGALAAGLGTRERVDGTLRDRESVLLARTLLDDALRHAVVTDPSTGAGPSATPFVQLGETSASDALDFVTRGLPSARGTPLGAGARWRVELRPTGGDAVLVAAPLDACIAPARVASETLRDCDAAPPLRAVLAGVRGVRVAALAPDGWRRDAQALERLPAAVRVDFVMEAGRAPLPPVVARTTDGGLR